MRELMTPWDQVPAVSPETLASDAVKLMAERRLDRVAVMHDGSLVGFVDPVAVRRYVELSGESPNDATRANAA